MKLNPQKRLAAEILKCSPKRIKFDTAELEDIKKSITKSAIRGLIAQGVIRKNHIKGISRGRAKHISLQVSKGRRRGQGSRKGKKTARLPHKLTWINRIRAQRELMKYLRDKNLISRSLYRELYMKAKGSFFRSRRHLKLYIKEHIK